MGTGHEIWHVEEINEIWHVEEINEIWHVEEIKRPWVWAMDIIKGDIKGLGWGTLDLAQDRNR